MAAVADVLLAAEPSRVTVSGVTIRGLTVGATVSRVAGGNVPVSWKGEAGAGRKKQGMKTVSTRSNRASICGIVEQEIRRVSGMGNKSAGIMLAHKQ